MTVPAHNSRRVYRGATRQAIPRSETSSDWYRELHPEMYKEIPSSKPVKPPPQPKTKKARSTEPKSTPARRLLREDTIVNYLRRHGDSTVYQIAAGLGFCTESIRNNLRRGIQGVVHTGMFVPDKGKPQKKWGVVKDEP